MRRMLGTEQPDGRAKPRRLIIVFLAFVAIIAVPMCGTAAGSSSNRPPNITAAQVITATSTISVYLPLAATPPPDIQPALPLRAAFYYPWFPETWKQAVSPYKNTNYTPTLGFYDSSDPAVIRQHITAMQYAHVQAGIASWWGQGTHTDRRIPTILAATAGSTFRWSVYYELEGQGNPTVSQITDDLSYLRDHFGNDPSYLRIDDRFVVFVYADAADSCEMADRWKQANVVNAYIVLKVVAGFQNCMSQPDGWHQYGPAVAASSHGRFSFAISPGFWKVGESQRLDRDLTRWRQNIRDMIASGATFQLITTFNEWGEGTAVESAQEWASASGYGAYLDALHDDGAQPAPLEPTSNHSLILTSDSPPALDPTPGALDQYVFLPNIFKPPDPVLVGAADIADCGSAGDEATAALLDEIPGTVFTAGDNAYDAGTAKEFVNCYEPSWGRQKARTRPAAGNHDYMTRGAAGYFNYFGTAAGNPSKGYYSYDLGQWHIIVVNSNCAEVGGCDAHSPQEQWVRADLAAHPALCTLAYWHHPRFSSGEHGSSTMMRPIWQALYEAGADVVLNGHDHDYERFAPQTPDGVADLQQGIREFVVGMGGKDHYAISRPIANSEAQNDDTFGVLKLTLHPTSYDWEFVQEAGKTFTDSGSASCH